MQIAQLPLYAAAAVLRTQFLLPGGDQYARGETACVGGGGGGSGGGGGGGGGGGDAPTPPSPSAVLRPVRSSNPAKYTVGSRPPLADASVNGWYVHAVRHDNGVSGPGYIDVGQYQPVAGAVRSPMPLAAPSGHAKSATATYALGSQAPPVATGSTADRGSSTPVVRR